MLVPADLGAEIGLTFPTLYAGQGYYLKLANYHTPHGQATSVIHSRIVRGTTEFADTRYRVWKALHAPVGTLH